MSSDNTNTTTYFTYDDALELASWLAMSQGSWGRYRDMLTDYTPEEIEAFNKAMERHEVIDSVDFILLIEG